jgi:hypothetical protein
MDLETFKAIHREGDGRSFCETCRMVTEFQVVGHGEIVCVTCGNEPKLDEE